MCTESWDVYILKVFVGQKSFSDAVSPRDWRPTRQLIPKILELQWQTELGVAQQADDLL